MPNADALVKPRKHPARWKTIPYKVFLRRYVRFELRRNGEVLAVVRPNYSGDWLVSIPGVGGDGVRRSLDEAKRHARSVVASRAQGEV